jgi:hypothetical protein
MRQGAGEGSVLKSVFFTSSPSRYSNTALAVERMSRIRRRLPPSDPSLRPLPPRPLLLQRMRLILLVLFVVLVFSVVSSLKKRLRSSDALVLSQTRSFGEVFGGFLTVKPCLDDEATINLRVRDVSA